MLINDKNINFVAANPFFKQKKKKKNVFETLYGIITPEMEL